MGVLHSEFLRILCETGIFGLMLFVFLLAYYGLYLLKVIKQNGVAKKYAVLSLSLLIFYTVTLSTDNSLDYVRQLGNYVFSFIGITFIFSDNDKRLNAMEEEV